MRKVRSPARRNSCWAGLMRLVPARPGTLAPRGHPSLGHPARSQPVDLHDSSRLRTHAAPTSDKDRDARSRSLPTTSASQRRPARSLDTRKPASTPCVQGRRVAAVEDDGVAHQARHHHEVGIAELIPLGDDRQGVGLFERAVGAVAIHELVTVDLANVRNGFGVVHADRRTPASSRASIRTKAGDFANIVGPRLEGQAPDGHGLVVQVAAEVVRRASGQAPIFGPRSRRPRTPSSSRRDLGNAPCGPPRERPWENTILRTRRLGTRS